MKIDGRVSKLKFEQEVSRLDAQAEALKKRGVVIHKLRYPIVEVVFIPRNNLAFHIPVSVPTGAAPPQLPPGVALPAGAKLQYMSAKDIHVLAGKAFGARISLDDFDQRAPSVVFCDPFTWEELPYEKLHRGFHIGKNGTSFNVLLDKHPQTKKPFLCMQGIREYHEHPQHTGDDWMQYRKYSGLCSTIDSIWRTCVHNSTPNLILQPPKIALHWVSQGVR